MANTIIPNGNNEHVVKTSKQWSEAAVAYRVIPLGTMCIEIASPTRFLLKVGDGERYYAKLPYIGGDIDLSNYYTKSETDEVIVNAIKQLGNVLRYKGIKKTVSELPQTGNKVGDIWLIDDIEDQSQELHVVHSVIWLPEEIWYAFDGYGYHDIDDYVTQEEFDEEVTRLDKRIDDIIAGSGHIHYNKEILDQITAPYTTEQQQILYKLDTHALLDLDKLRLYCDDDGIGE